MPINSKHPRLKRKKFVELSGSHSEFHGHSSCIPALQRWSYARHYFAYLKWEGELNMFMSFFNVFWKNKANNLTYQNRRLLKDPLLSFPLNKDVSLEK